tara:strand:- start:1217 stop:1492 length:276 start_codon:yes stop_codon:yes gene_type:complete
MGKYSSLLGQLSKSSKGVGKEAEKTIKKAKKADPNSDWKKGLSKDELADILGSPKTDAEGILMHRKKGGKVKAKARGAGAAKRGFGVVRKK